jgi:hypothetical protein
MNSTECLNILKCLCLRNEANCTYDVVASDELLDVNVLGYPVCIISNTKPSSHAGEHWVAFYMYSINSPMEFFCSYGNSISSYDNNFKKFCNMYSDRIVSRSVQLQSFGSKVCGYYALYFIARRLKNCTRENFYDTFSNNLKNNDKIVFNFFCKQSSLFHFTICKESHVQCCKIFKE